jgi:hypothetical protein
MTLTPEAGRLDADWATRKLRRLRYPITLAGNNSTRAFVAGEEKPWLGKEGLR